MVTPGKIIAPDDSEILMMMASCNFLIVLRHLSGARRWPLGEEFPHALN